MSNNNSTNMVGNLGNDPELRFTTSGRAVTNFRLGVNERVYRDGEPQDRTTWLNVVCWNDMAENVAVSLSKGDRIQLTGRLQIRAFNPANNPDEKAYFTEVVADEIGVALRWAVVGEVEKTGRTKQVDKDTGEILESDTAAA